MNKNTTALFCLYARYYHTKYSDVKIYNDELSSLILSEKEINDITTSLTKGINYFNPNYNGNEPVKWIINNYFAPTVLARSIFNENHLLNEIKLGLKQYVILASGYDTSSFKVNNRIKVFELDKSLMIEDKLLRIQNANINTQNITYIKTDFTHDWINKLINNGFNPKQKTQCSLLGISYYLDKNTFFNTLNILANNIPIGSSIIFDYPNYDESENENKNRMLANKANEEMKSKYSYKEIEHFADQNNLLIYEHLNNKDIDNTYFKEYNKANPNNMIKAFSGTSLCLLIKH